MPKTSAGLLPFRDAPDGSVEVLLVHPGGPLWKDRDDHAWSVAKGEYGPDEGALAAAEREFAEETGWPAPPGDRLDLGEVRQSGGKIVRAWAVAGADLSTERVVSNRFELEWPPRSGVMCSFPEVDRAEWTDIATARTRMVRAQVLFLDRLLERVERRG
jgi:predicted NUDIX family NTP pyrophosphohydrolase